MKTHRVLRYDDPTLARRLKVGEEVMHKERCRVVRIDSDLDFLVEVLDETISVPDARVGVSPSFALAQQMAAGMGPASKEPA